MKKMFYVIAGIALAVVTVPILVCLTTGCKKADPDTIDGGVVKSYTDPDAPKVIESTEITDFDCTVSMLSSSYEEFRGREYSFKATLQDNSVKGTYSYYTRGSDDRADYSFEADDGFMSSLYGIVSKYELSQHNGYYHFVSGLPAMYGSKLTVLFASGEKIYASDNQSSFIGADVLRELIALFEGSAGVKNEKEWSGIEFSRSHMNWNYCFNISILPDAEGNTVVSGFCNDSDGTEYSVDDYFVISDEGLEKLKALSLDDLPKAKKKPFFGIQVDDETTEKLLLLYPDGSEEEKELSSDTLTAIFDIALSEFKRNAENNASDTSE
ncbi:MAG: hypothetical protein IJD22_07880 [Clostridia bacterium]|nr:hypothetical protein [Clostridia bacterium]